MVEQLVLLWLRDRGERAGVIREIELSSPILEWDIVDSLGLFELVEFCEDRFDVSIDDAELQPENFETPEALIRLIRSKTDA